MRYLNLFSALFNHSIKRYFENRGNTLGNVFFMSLNFILQVYLLDIMFLHTQTIAGWTKSEVFLIAGLSRLFTTIFSLLFQRSINHLVFEIAEGNLDLILTKPFNAQFYYSFFLIRAFEIFNILAPLALIGYALSNLQAHFSLFQLFSMTIVLLCGLIIFYSLYIMIACLTFWVGRFNAFSSLFNILTVPMSMPTDIYGKNANFVFTFIIPLAFLVTIPAKLFLGKISFVYLIIGVYFAITLLLCSIQFWNIAIKRYSSASS